MHYLASAWSAVTPATFEHCFNKSFGVRADDTIEAVGDSAFADCDELNTAMETVGASGIAYSDYASVDDAVVTSTMLSVDDIVAECADLCARDEEVEEEVERIPELTSSSAIAALDLLRRYVRTSDDGESHMALQVLVLVGHQKHAKKETSSQWQAALLSEALEDQVWAVQRARAVTEDLKRCSSNDVSLAV
ncbi:hypothetical protein HPB51_016179 [Rhipicephalus microplus]|uniref:Tick transposon n=1 Tax=Rhipicephalus microplus TaxID=6941 RepID=A0A9J6E202_RHIMP|nr:hypothetical protein HPB51_016179 [Rhipicephalus microplus]